MKPIHFFWISLSIVLTAFSYRFLYADNKTLPVLPDDTSITVPIVPDDSVPDSVPEVLIPKPTTNDWTNSSNSNNSTINSTNNGNNSSNKISSARWPRVTQWEYEHVKQWQGSMFATDIVYPTKDIPFPDTYGDYLIYHIGQDKVIGDYIIIRHWKERWVYWHTQTSRKWWEWVSWADGLVLWQSNLSWLTAWLHTHREYWVCKEQESKMKDCFNTSSKWEVAERNQAIIEQRGWGDKEKSTEVIWWSTEKNEVWEESKRVVSKEVDLDKLARAVAMAETGGCTKGTGLSKNNCHWIKSGNTYKCKSPKGTMCHFDTKEESYIAFKVIWARWYKTLPTIKQATVWTGADKADHWRRIVFDEYNK